MTAVISVRDNGLGIAEEMLPRVFDFFTQIQHSANRAQGGLGIGLTLVRRPVGDKTKTAVAPAKQDSIFIW